MFQPNQIEAPPNVERNTARTYVDSLFRQSISMDNPDFVNKLNDSTKNQNENQDSNHEDSQNEKPLKQAKDNYVSVQNIYGIPDSSRLSYNK